MEKINFTDATLTAQAKVTIDGTDYNVTDATYSGGTDLNASTFNTMQTNMENAISSYHTYSTTEKVIGTWYNGKPIYRKVIERATLVDCIASDWTSVADISGLNISYCVSSILLAQNGWAWNGYLLRNNSGNLQVFNVGTTWNVKTIVIDYIKTTD